MERMKGEKHLKIRCLLKENREETWTSVHQYSDLTWESQKLMIKSKF